MVSWRRFDIESFLESSKGWDDDIEKLQRELDNLPELPAVSNDSGIHSGKVSDLTAQTVIKKLKIQADIEELKLNKEMLVYAVRRLSEDEIKLLKGFFYPRKPIGIFVHEYGLDHGLGKNLVYAERKKLLEKMRMLIEGEFYGEE